MKTDVLVIGGGIAGCALAYFLGKEGVETILLEKSGLNCQASGANSGSIHGQIPHDIFLDKGEGCRQECREIYNFQLEIQTVLEHHLTNGGVT